MSFTLFVILPNEDVCSLRSLTSGTSIRSVRKKLELAAGLPAQTYRLTCPEGQLLHEDHVLKLDSNVWDGFIVRAVFLDSWQELYERVVADDVTHVVQHGAVHMRSDVVWADAADESRAREVMGERGVVALFVASFLGMQEMCKALLSVGVNPNGKTPFGRTPLFAAMSRDNDHVMELLLSHKAELESRDVDGATAVEVARRAMAKQCMRKVRHLQLQSKGAESHASARAPSQSSSGQQRRRLGPRVIRIPTGASVQREPSSASTPNGRPPALTQFRGESSDRASLVSASNGFHPRTPAPAEAKARHNGTFQHAVPRTSRFPHSKAPLPQGREGGLYAWENNLTHVSRAPSAAGTVVRVSVGSSSSGSRAARGGYGISSSDTMSIGSATSRMLPFRPTVYDISAKGPGSVLTTSATSAAAHPATITTMHNLEREDTSSVLGKSRRPSALVKYCSRLPPPAPEASLNPHQPSEPDGPAQEPPERPPSRHEPTFTQPGSEADDGPQGESVGNGSVMGSQEALSVGSAPELLTSRREAELGVALQAVEQGESDDDGGRVVTSRGKTLRSSGSVRTRLLVSRQKQQESWRTMKRRIRLAEEQKRSVSTKAKHKGKTDKDSKESFEQWLDRKRKEQQRQQRSSDEDTSGDDSDAENSQAFNDWLKDLKERPQRRPHTSTPASLHRRKTRPLKDLIQVGGNTERALVQPDPDSYMLAYREWQHKKNTGDTRQLGSLVDIKEAKRQLEEKRKSLLAMALTYEDWLEHTEERKKLMQTILRADLEQLAAVEQHLFRTRRAPRQISFNEWREKIDKREAEIRQQRHRMRREAELRQQNGYFGDEFTWSSAAIAHEEWVKRKKEEALKKRSKGKLLPDADAKGGASTNMSEDEKQAAWEAWLEHKHRQEVAQLDQHLRQERQLLLSLRQKKTPTVTQC